MRRKEAQLAVTNPVLPPAFGGVAPKNLPELRSVIAQAMDAWLRKRESERTRVAYKNDVEQFLEFLGLNPAHIEHMARVLPEDVAAWRDHLLTAGGRPDEHGGLTRASNATVSRKLTSLRSFFSFLQSYGYRGANPAHPHFVDAPKVPDVGQTPAIPPKKVLKLLSAPEIETPSGVRDRGWLSILAYMAVRVDELHLMNVGNISQDGEHTIIRIKGKGNTTRKGVIPPVAARAVNDWLKLADIREDHRGPLFRPGVSARGNGLDGFKRSRLSVRAIQWRVKRYCADVGIDSTVSVHSLRVTAATEAHRAGVPLDEIQRWLGHKDPRTTLRYIRTGESLDRSPAYVIRYS